MHNFDVLDNICSTLEETFVHTQGKERKGNINVGATGAKINDWKRFRRCVLL